MAADRRSKIPGISSPSTDIFIQIAPGQILSACAQQASKPVDDRRFLLPAPIASRHVVSDAFCAGKPNWTRVDSVRMVAGEPSHDVRSPESGGEGRRRTHQRQGCCLSSDLKSEDATGLPSSPYSFDQDFSLAFFEDVTDRRGGPAPFPPHAPAHPPR